MTPVYIVTEGDSLTLGSFSTNGLTYPRQLSLLCSADNRMVAVSNMGDNGATLTSMTTGAAIQLDPQYDANKGTNHIVIWGGTNDMGNGDSGATAYARMVTLCNARKAIGFRVVCVTCMPRTRGLDPADFEDQRLAFNASIRANWTTFAHALADVGADSRLGVNGCQDDTTYFHTDKIHLNNTGYGVVAALVKAQLDALL